ncbi:MAG: hypothetical protein HWN65_20605 [Candidatus Helarchaeota archaeon]|nr:hypothetical protein [Candidatus Helarchaeota archaeon]
MANEYEVTYMGKWIGGFILVGIGIVFTWSGVLTALRDAALFTSLLRIAGSILLLIGSILLALGCLLLLKARKPIEQELKIAERHLAENNFVSAASHYHRVAKTYEKNQDFENAKVYHTIAADLREE